LVAVFGNNRESPVISPQGFKEKVGITVFLQVNGLSTLVRMIADCQGCFWVLQQKLPFYA
jgi:hypothetical protein